MPPREDLIVFLDLETTGSSKTEDEIIEIGMVMLDATKEDVPEIGSFTRVIKPSDSGLIRLMNKRIVRQMHEANGLLSDIVDMIDAPPATAGEYEDQSLGGAEDQALDWLRGFVGDDRTHIPFGGSGVMHFDGPFMERHVPRLRSRFTYWAYDVGPIRRTFQKAGVPFASMDAKTHRALDDARVHAAEFRWYLRFAQRGYLATGGIDHAVTA